MRGRWLSDLIDFIAFLFILERREKAEAGCRAVLHHGLLILGVTAGGALLGGVLLHGAEIPLPFIGDVVAIHPASIGWGWACLLGGAFAFIISTMVVSFAASPPPRMPRRTESVPRRNSPPPPTVEFGREEPERRPWAIALEDLAAWTASRPSPATAWAECPRGDWMLELAVPGAADPFSPGRRRLVLAAGSCARRGTGKDGPPDGRVKRFLDGAEAWARSAVRETPGSLGGDYAEAAEEDGSDIEAVATLAVADAVASHAAGRTEGDPGLDALVADPAFLRRAADAAAFRAAALVFDPTDAGLVATFAALAEAGGSDARWRGRVVAALGSMAEEIRGLYPHPRTRGPRGPAPPSPG